ncbi:MAG: hypothetical protein WAT93_02685 [Pontixanthobacter sp.]
MIVASILLAAQTVQTLAPPITEPRPATGWHCSFTDSTGDSFWLKGLFPEAPVGWNPNEGMSTVLEGEAPKPFLGEKMVKAFRSNTEYRNYFLSLAGDKGDRYNFTFSFLRDQNGMVNVTRYDPAALDGQGLLTTFATGHCTSEFRPKSAGASS